MKAMEATGKTVEEAVQKAIDRLGINKSHAQVQVLDEPNQGLFGFLGNKSARVLVTMRYEPTEYLQQYLEEMLVLMRVDGKVRVTEDEDAYYVNIEGPCSGVLIGRRGKTLNEIQYLAGIIVRRRYPGEPKRVIVDAGGYRQRREQTLHRLAENAADRVLSAGREISLEPMPPQERRIIHLALQEYSGVYTYSTGEDPYRKVIIAPK